MAARVLPFRVPEKEPDEPEIKRTDEERLSSLATLALILKTISTDLEKHLEEFTKDYSEMKRAQLTGRKKTGGPKRNEKEPPTLG